MIYGGRGASSSRGASGKGSSFGKLNNSQYNYLNDTYGKRIDSVTGRYGKQLNYGTVFTAENIYEDKNGDYTTHDKPTFRLEMNPNMPNSNEMLKKGDWFEYENSMTGRKIFKPAGDPQVSKNGVAYDWYSPKKPVAIYQNGKRTPLK